MSISYPVNVEETLWSVLDLSEGEIIGRNKKWPVANGTEIQGADPNFVYLLQSEGVKPDYDPRTHVLDIVETKDAAANTIVKTYGTTKRPLEEINSALEAEERQALEGVMPYDQREKLILLGLAVLFRQIDGQTLNAKEQVIATRVQTVGMKLWKNDATLRAKVQDFADGNNPDPSEGWEKE